MAKRIVANQDCTDHGWSRVSVSIHHLHDVLDISRVVLTEFLDDPSRPGEWSVGINPVANIWEFEISDPGVAFEFKMRFA